MALLFYSRDDNGALWKDLLEAELPDLEVRLHPDALGAGEVGSRGLGDPCEITMALVWLPPAGLLRDLPNLEAIFSLAAGVDAMLKDETLPDVPLCRLVDPSLTAAMTSFVLALVLRFHRHLDLYERDTRRALWRRRELDWPRDTTIGIMGLGALGRDVAAELVRQGFVVRGWSRSRKEVDGVEAFAGEAEVEPFLSACQMLVCLLPLTSETRGILNARLFERLPQGAKIINVARGEHLVEEDLLASLERGHITGAALDVTANEPLPPESRLWRHPHVLITPHAASYADPRIAAKSVARNIERLRNGQPLEAVVNRERGY